MAIIVGYADRNSVRPGEVVALKVSSEARSSYRADLVRIISADPNPDGPGIRLDEVDCDFAGSYPSRFQPSRPGSCGIIQPAAPIALPAEATISLRMQPRLLDGRRQVAVWLDFGAGKSAAVTVGEGGLALEFGGRIANFPGSVARHEWYELILAITPDRLSLSATELGRRGANIGSVELPLPGPLTELHTVLLAAELSGTAYGGFFNGRLEDPAILKGVVTAPIHLSEADPRLIAWWDFGLDIRTTVIRDRGPLGMDGRLFNLPTRGVRGSFWSGDEMCWRHAPRDYAAIHFHEDDLYDCLWEIDFDFVVPPTLASGVYGVRLRVDGSEDIVPIFVLPQRGEENRIAVLFPTITYQVYANFRRSNFDDAYRQRREAWGAYANHPAENEHLGPSTYDRHPDGSGVVHASSRRPFITMRPGYLAYIDPHGSGLRHLPADMHLVSWLVEKGIPFDVLTDHDLDREGVELLAPYRLVVTTTHPEYQTKHTLDSIEPIAPTLAASPISAATGSTGASPAATTFPTSMRSGGRRRGPAPGNRRPANTTTRSTAAMAASGFATAGLRRRPSAWEWRLRAISPARIIRGRPTSRRAPLGCSRASTIPFSGISACREGELPASSWTASTSDSERRKRRSFWRRPGITRSTIISACQRKSPTRRRRRRPISGHRSEPTSASSRNLTDVSCSPSDRSRSVAACPTTTIITTSRACWTTSCAGCSSRD
ncbi:hypothetical protein LB558_06750 [Mesorhizobium sp. CO1-1-8]|nr:N,N-dimethylformamidase beta subunit family domain-containing protein [Mesorhizobium sp. CO1-1-8]MBZ9772227.1 hypothetical protein [Mesorhizobium sp. CO1-1-8]